MRLTGVADLKCRRPDLGFGNGGSFIAPPWFGGAFLETQSEPGSHFSGFSPSFLIAVDAADALRNSGVVLGRPSSEFKLNTQHVRNTHHVALRTPASTERASIVVRHDPGRHRRCRALCSVRVDQECPRRTAH